MDKLTFNASNNVSMVEPSEGAGKVHPFYDANQCILVNEKVTEFRLKGKEMLRFSALVKIEGDGWVEFDVDSQHGGKTKKRVNINIQ